MLVKGIVAQGDPEGPTLEGALGEAVGGKQIDRLDVAVAYATKQGLAALRDAIGGWPPVTRWVVGLDDAITQPAAIDELLGLPGAQVRFAALSGEGRRFHPKLYCLWSTQNPAECVALVGSANMTVHGLRRNGEVGTIIDAESIADAEKLKASWTAMSALGQDSASVDLEAYRAAYGRARKARKRMQKIGAMPALPEAEEGLNRQPLDGDPATAPHAWLEIGKATQGKEVEIPKPLLPFFRVPAGTSSAYRQFSLPNGLERPLRLIDRRGNSMWRIEFTSETIQGLAGRNLFYQPNGNKRSELVLAIEHQPNSDDLLVRTVTLGTPAFEDLKAASDSIGAARRTIPGPTGRE